MAHQVSPPRKSRPPILVLVAVVMVSVAGATWWRSAASSSNESSSTPLADASSGTASRSRAVIAESPAGAAPSVPIEPSPPATPAPDTREIELAIALEELVHRDPQAADEFLRALPESDRRRTVAAVLTATAGQPQDAIDLANRFIRADPENSTAHGYSLIHALTRVGQANSALQFVQAQNAAPGESEDPSKWSRALFAAWSETQPEVALQNAARLPSGELQEEALRAVAKVWAKANPVAAADSAQRLPSGPGRGAALETSLHAWADQDANAAGQWLAGVSGNSDLDGASSTLATHPLILAQNPATAAGWAERITDPELRSRTVAEVLKNWGQKNPSEARRYAERAMAGLLPHDRAQVLAALNRPPE